MVCYEERNNYLVSCYNFTKFLSIYDINHAHNLISVLLVTLLFALAVALFPLKVFLFTGYHIFLLLTAEKGSGNKPILVRFVITLLFLLQVQYSSHLSLHMCVLYSCALFEQLV